MDLDLDAITARLAALPATGFIGPYSTVTEDVCTWVTAEDKRCLVPQDIAWTLKTEMDGDIATSVGGMEPRVRETLAYLAAAGNALPALLAEVERLRALPRMTPELAAALEKLEDWDRGLLIPMLSSQCRRILYAYRAAKETTAHD